MLTQVRNRRFRHQKVTFDHPSFILPIAVGEDFYLDNIWVYLIVGYYKYPPTPAAEEKFYTKKNRLPEKATYYLF